LYRKHAGLAADVLSLRKKLGSLVKAETDTLDKLAQDAADETVT